MLKGKDKSLNIDEKTIRPRDDSIEIRFFGPRGVEMPTCGPPRSLEKGASQGPPALVNLPPQWGPDGRQQSASVIDADGRHLLRQLGANAVVGPSVQTFFIA